MGVNNSFVHIRYGMVQVVLQAPPLAVETDKRAAKQEHDIIQVMVPEDLVVAILVRCPPKLSKTQGHNNGCQHLVRKGVGIDAHECRADHQR
jgi:hypothetical protein